jgi:hypothetical protein
MKILKRIRMILNPTPTMFIILIFGVSTFIFIMLLPALFELKRPKDAGPRKIMDNIIAVPQFQLGRIISLMNVEEEKLGFDQVLVKKTADIIAFLPNLEA